MVVDGLSILDTIKELDRISTELLYMYPDIKTSEQVEEKTIKAAIKKNIIALKYLDYELTREALSHAD